MSLHFIYNHFTPVFFILERTHDLWSNGWFCSFVTYSRVEHFYITNDITRIVQTFTGVSEFLGVCFNDSVHWHGLHKSPTGSSKTGHFFFLLGAGSNPFIHNSYHAK